MNSSSPPFVKKFDFRGVYGKDITDVDAFYVGLALEKTIPLKKVLIGWDTRVSSKWLARNFMHALQGKGIEISYVEKCPIDYITAGANVFDFDLSVMFTGSHNPWDWTGLLMHTKGGVSVQGEIVEKIIKNYADVVALPYSSPSDDLAPFHNVETMIEKIYAEKIVSLIPLASIPPLRVLVDIGDGSGGKALSILEKLLPQVTFTRLNDREIYDETSSHIADPSNIENMQELMTEMKKGNYSCGFAFDSDADRVLAVDETGEYINGSLLGSAIVDVFANTQVDSSPVGYAVECGPSLYNTVMDHKKNGKNISVVPVPVGRSLLRQMVFDGKIAIGVENVGHFYLKDLFMTDSGVFSLAVVLYWISNNGSLSTLRSLHPDGNREQFSLPITKIQEEEQKKLTAEITSHYENKKTRKIIVDGIRDEVFDGNTMTSWFSIRPSGYEKIEKYYFGSLNNVEYEYIKEVFNRFKNRS